MNKITFERSFASHEKSKYWSSKNGDITPRDIAKSTHTKYIFNCVCGHEFETSPNKISIGRWCPYCASVRLCNNEDCKKCFDKSFASNEKSKFWSDKNDLQPREVFKFSLNKYLFNCECGHEFEIGISSVSNKQWCSYCCIPSQKLCNNESCQQCFNKSFASHEKSQYWSEKNKLKSREVFKMSHNKYIFNCTKCNHEFESSLDNITHGNTWCPYCVNKKICDNNNCNKCFQISFASYEKSKYWSNKNKVLPRNVIKGSKEKYIFNCIDCNHEFETSLNSVSKGSWCPFCTNQQLCNNENCKLCFEKSFASHEKSQFWSDKNELKPRNVFKSSGKKYIFNCICGHEFDILLNSLSSDGHWCPYCSNPPQKLCDDENCQSCFEKSFASHEKSKFWSIKNELKPRNVFKGSRYKYIFNCKYGHEFQIQVYNISCNQWCSKCRHKTEKKLYEILNNDYIDIKNQFKQDWSKNIETNKYLIYDFVLEKEKIIIELDGEQHFKQVSNWSSPEDQLKRDLYKMECANNNGFSIIRILQEDVFNDTFDWYTTLKESIETIIQNKSIENHFISLNENKYINYY